MLKTNNKLVKERIRNYILDNADAENYNSTDFMNWREAAVFVYDCMMDIMKEDQSFRNRPMYDKFEYWVKGLPNEFDLPFIYVASAVDILGDILEETEEERNKYSETDAENLFLHLIWREIEYAVRKENK